MADEFDLIDDVYQYRSTIYRGNQTRVDEVVEQGTGRQFAMKIVIEGTPESKESKANLKKEAMVLKQMEHPNIIHFEKFSTSHDATYILMEYFRAANVKSQLKGELYSLHSRARPLLEGACQALAFLHEKGWIHRDLKPDNMLLNRAGEFRLLDFSLSSRMTQGVAKMFGMGRPGSIQGTRTYIAPETIRRQAPTP
ncbi:MAG: protein kinase, partial [Planctomycetaceae bacterium]